MKNETKRALRGAVVMVALGMLMVSVTGAAAEPGLSPSTAASATPDAATTLGLLVGTSLGGFLLLLGAVWTIVLGFQVGVGWGFITLLVPFGQLAFTYQFWDRAKRAFWVRVAGFGVVMLAVLGIAVGRYKQNAAAHLASQATSAPIELAASSLPSPPPAATPVHLPPMGGVPVDLSTIMGRARALADGWQREATLCSIDAALSGGLIATQDGGKATLVFGPSPFAATAQKAGRFVVIYDSTGLHGEASSEAPGKALVEPMCSPEEALRRASASTGPVTLRYALDSKGKQAVWLATVAGTTKAFDNRSCSAAAL